MVITRSTRPRRDAAATPASNPNPPNERSSKRKRQKLSAPTDDSTSSFLNPFGYHSENSQLPISAPDNANEVSAFDNSFMEVVPPDQYQYGLTPALTVAEQEIADRQAAEFRLALPIPALISPPSTNFPDVHTVTPASNHVIDPKLFLDVTSPTSAAFSIPKPPVKAILFGAIPKTNRTIAPLPTITKKPIAHHNPTNSSSTRTHSPESPQIPVLIPVPQILVKKPIDAGGAQSQTPQNSADRTELLRSQPSSIPKAFTDKLMAHESRLVDLERRVEYASDAQTCWEAQYLRDLGDISNEQCIMLGKIAQLEEIVKNQNKTIEALSQLVKSSRTQAESSDSEESAPKPKPQRNNSLNTATRRSLIVAMGLPRTSKLRDAAAISASRTGGSYIKDQESDGKVLRPDWSASFAENSSWHESMIRFVRAKASTFVPAIGSLNKTTDATILNRLEVVFKNIAAEYRTAHATAGNTDDLDPEQPPPNMTVAEKARFNRRKQRKVGKSEERLATVEEEGLDLPDEWKFGLQPAYQSTDESDDTDVIDPDTDTERNAEVPFDDGMVTLDVYVMKRRERFEKNNRGKTGRHLRVRGDKKDTPLPFMGRKKLKIPRGVVDPVWLSTHQNQDTPSRIYDADQSEDENELVAGTEEADGDISGGDESDEDEDEIHYSYDRANDE
ncbi:hypothetical protein C8R43DRAFT_1178685 [Mycena crocata]|nr:hypothetical protein C8R43DRAFT_1178685 [Mycena crocata]